MRSLKIYRLRHIAEEGGIVRCLYIDIGRFRILFAIGETAWRERGKNHRIPIFFREKAFFCHRLAIRIGKPEFKEDE